jgi:hypothetical protein
LMTAPLLIMNVSSRWRCGYHPHCCCTNSQRVHRGLLAGGRNTQGKHMEGGAQGTCWHSLASHQVYIPDNDARKLVGDHR